MAVDYGGTTNTLITNADNSWWDSTNYPMTWAGWCYGSAWYSRLDNGSANRVVAQAGSTAYAYTDDDFDPGHRAQLTDIYASWTEGYIDGWWHFCARMSSSSNRSIYVNGGTANGGTQAVNTAGTGLNLSTPSSGFGSTGFIADFAFWKADLSDAEVRFLANGGKVIQLSNHKSNLITHLISRQNAFDDQVKNYSNAGNHTPIVTGAPAFPYR